MRNLPDKRRFIFGIIVVCFILFADISNAQQPLNPNGRHVTDSPNYLPGKINIKLAPGIQPVSGSSGSVSFGIPELDILVEEYRISRIAKRFKHKPIPRGSGLPDIDRIYLLEFPLDLDVWTVSEAFAFDPNIEYAEPVPVHHTTVIPDDPMYGTLQHLPQIMAEEAWEVHKGEDGTEEIIIAIVDTGVDWDHEDLQDNVWQNLGEDADGDGHTMEFNGSSWELDPGDLNGSDDDGNGFTDDLIGWNFFLSNSDVNPIPSNPVGDHGTHCAGIAAGVTNNATGIASISWNLSVMGVCADANNSLQFGYDGIIYAAENGADVISNSWSGPNFSQVNQDVIDYATGLGSIVLAAAGNHNSLDLHYPASYANAISVASVSEDDTKAPYSAYNFAVDIAAPGGGTEGGITSTVPDDNYANKSGTSMATPLVAGCLGLLKSYHPDWDNTALLTQLLGTTDDINGLNPDYAYYLGSGRVNAYQALTGENVTPPDLLKIQIMDFDLEDNNGNGMLEPGETITISVTFHNYSQLTGNDEVTFTLTTYDPDVSLNNGSFTTSVPPDGEFEVVDAFSFVISEEANTHVATFFIEASSDIQVVMGEESTMRFVIAPSGFFVWEGGLNDGQYSGAFIADYLTEQGYELLHTDVYPLSFAGFDAVFLSFGNGGEDVNEAVLFEPRHMDPIKAYLIAGGRLYTDGMAIMSIPDYFGYPNAAVFTNLFGVATTNVQFQSNPISSLEGQDGTPGHDMLFTESTQVNNWYIDFITPTSSAVTPFYEDNYGYVSVANDGSFNQKTFYLGYNLASLVDVDPLSSRYNLMVRILDHLGFPQDDDFVVANFTEDKTELLPGEEIQFHDFSIAAEGTSISSWWWDLDGDGAADASEPDPVWSYDQGGSFDVTLIVSNGISTDTLTRENHVLVRDGIFVYEGMENGTDQSGGFIRDNLIDMGHPVVYSNHFPTSLDGFDAVFASFGSAYYESPFLDDKMANSIKNYLLAGGRMYLEGANALGNDQSGNNLLWYTFGIDETLPGQLNEISSLEGQQGSIMEGIEFLASGQFDNHNIDIYVPYEDEYIIPAFIEDGYGIVGIQFDGTGYYGQKTFCLSYSMAELVDGEPPATREEMLQRIMDFFDVATSINENDLRGAAPCRLFPVPANDRVTLEMETSIPGGAQVGVFDLLGKKVISRRIEAKRSVPINVSIDVQNLEPGTYIWQVTGENVLHAGKLIITR